MSREVLLTLLGTLLVINVGVLISIGLLGRRGRASRAEPAKAAAGRTTDATSAGVGATRGVAVSPAEAGVSISEVGAVTREAEAPTPDVEAPTPDVEAAVASVGRVPRLVRAEPVLAAAPVEARLEAPIGVAVIEAEHESETLAGNGHFEHGLDALEPADDRPSRLDNEPAPIQHATVATNRNDAPSTSAGSRRRRSRRFVLPPLEEDSDRSARAIEAFLGEASVAPPLAHPERLQRRRHRARRAPGSKASRTSLIVDLVGYRELTVAAGEGQAARLAGALAEALWRSARIGDEVRELAPGRIQLVLDCDQVGAEAFARRARSSVGPWLAATPVPVSMEIGALAAVPPEGGSAAG
jgi:hypothetical protein